MTDDDSSKPTGEPADGAGTPAEPTDGDATATRPVDLTKAPTDEAAEEAGDAAAATDEPAAAPDDATATADAAAPDEPSGRSPLSSMALAAAVAALIAAVVCLGYFGYTGIKAYTVDAATETLRTESVDAAEQAVLNITSVDPTDAAGWKKRLESSLTGEALKQVNASVVADIEKQVQASGGKAGKIESRIARSAATEVDRSEDRATVLVYANVKSTVPNQPVAQQQMGFLLTMVDVDGTRKAEKVVALQTLEYSDAQSGVTQNNQQGGGN
ncbi:hypothetical protein [Gordonia aichiensis]|uniref:hypothetical protein n=1 Tax=Gordonia aichiensis TaxID=36820 RepID=UPI003263A2DB